jgi:hypothetical protein
MIKIIQYQSTNDFQATFAARVLARKIILTYPILMTLFSKNK